MAKMKKKWIDLTLGQLDAQALLATHTAANYTPAQVGSEGTDKISAHLKGIDAALLASSTDEKVKVSSNDTTAKYLEDAIVVSDGSNATNILELSTLNDGGDEDVQIQIDQSKIDHGSLAGLGDDDHSQYHNDTRGDARYYTKTLLNSTSNAEGASLIGIEDSAAQFTSTNVEGALAEALDAAQAAQSDIDGHLDGGASKHDATEIDYERVDGSKKNVQSSSDDVELALTDLDDAIGALASSPTNYTPSNAAIVADHLSAIDSELGTLSSTMSNFEWQESALDYITDNTAAPPTEVSGDRYVLSHDGGAPHANWDGASAGDVVEFDGSVWVAVTPSVGMFVAVDDDSSGLYLWGGAAWAFKSFEATTASTGLTKVGFDIRLDSGAAGAGLGFSAGVLSVNVDDNAIKVVTDTLRGLIAGQEKFTLIAGDITNGYVDLAVAAHSAESISVYPVGGAMQEQGVDYTVSLTGGAGSTTRITFAGDLAAELVATDKLVVKYEKRA